MHYTFISNNAVSELLDAMRTRGRRMWRPVETCLLIPPAPYLHLDKKKQHKKLNTIIIILQW